MKTAPSYNLSYIVENLIISQQIGIIDCQRASQVNNFSAILVIVAQEPKKFKLQSRHWLCSDKLGFVVQLMMLSLLNLFAPCQSV